MLSSFPTPMTVCVFGASGGIGIALVKRLADDPAVETVHAGSRSPIAAKSKIRPFRFDLTDEASIADAAARIGGCDLVIIATGLLHDDSIRPEKSFRSQSGDAYARAFAINATGPALIGKHFLPLLPRDRRALFAAISARVGSISDNRLGGWHAYRASKAALNMIIRNFAIELTRTHAEAIAVSLHPGTVDTGLSEPFQRNIEPGKPFTADHSAERLLSVLDGVSMADNGKLIAWDGQTIAF